MQQFPTKQVHYHDLGKARAVAGLADRVVWGMQYVMPVNILYTYTQHYDTATAVNTLTQSEGISGHSLQL